jgi:hypothetical protein
MASAPVVPHLRLPVPLVPLFSASSLSDSAALPPPSVGDVLDHVLEDAKPVQLPVMCDGCLGRTAYHFCEDCRDSMCSACFLAVHKGRLARHRSYPVQQPLGVEPDMTPLVPAVGPSSAREQRSHGEHMLLNQRTREGAPKAEVALEEDEEEEEEEVGGDRRDDEEERGVAAPASASASATASASMVGASASMASASASTASNMEALPPLPSRAPAAAAAAAPINPWGQLAPRTMTAEMKKRQIEKKMGLEAAVSADGMDEAVTLEDIARYIRRRRRLGQLGPRLQQRAHLQPGSAVMDAGDALLTEQKAFEVGGFTFLANQKPDPWMAAAEYHGGGVTAYK